jgi:hypothetical protein
VNLDGRTDGCECQDTPALLLDALEGRQRHLCPVHDREAIAEREHDEELHRIAEREHAIGEVADRYRNPPADKPTPLVDVRQLITEQFTGTAGTSTPLGGEGIDQALAAVFGVTAPLDPRETY